MIRVCSSIWQSSGFVFRRLQVRFLSGAPLIALAFAGCATPAPRIVTTPAVCPAPRTPPAQTLGAIAALPDHLPALVIDGDAATALWRNGIESAGLYRQCVEAARGAAGWIEGAD